MPGGNGSESAEDRRFSVAIDIRPIRAEEIETARRFLPDDAAEPAWGSCYLVSDGEAAGILGTEVRLSGLLVQLVAEPLYIREGSAAGLVAIGFLDALMRCIASVNRLPGYGFTIRDCNRRFQNLVERRFPVAVTQGNGERHYYRQF
jgi:hypothetical protein